MTHDRNAFKAGLFIILSIILIILVAVGIKGIARLLEPNQMRTAYFKLTDDVSGLQVGDDVRVGGLRVGVVRGLEIVGATPASPSASQQPRIAVTFQMPRRLVLRAGTRIAVQGTLTGASWLNIESMGTGSPLGPQAALIGSPGAYAQVFTALGQVAPELRDLVRDIRSTTVPRANQALVTFNNTGLRAGEAMVQVRDLFGDTRSDFRSTIANLSSATGTIKQKLPAIMDKADTLLAKAQSSIDKVYSSLDDVKATMANARDLTAAGRSILDGNRGKIDSMVANLKSMSDNLKFAAAEVRRSPWRLLYKPGKDELANLNLYDAARQFAEGANDVSDAAVSLRDALADPRVNGASLQKLIDQLDHSFTGFKKVENDLWKQVRQD